MGVPVVDVTYDPSLPSELLDGLRSALPDVVAEAVDCPEEPWTGPPEPGDIELRFRPRHELDVGGLPVTIEIRTKWFESRVRDRQRRADLVQERLRATIGTVDVGVWLIPHEGAWSQT